MVLSLLVVYYDSSLCKLTIWVIVLVNLESDSVVRVHTNHGRSNSDAHVLELPPKLHLLIVFGLQRLIHFDDWIRFVIPRSVNFIDLGHWASSLLSKSVVILLKPVLIEIFLDELSDDVVSLGWFSSSVASFCESLSSWSLRVLCRSVVINTSISWDTCTSVSN